MKMFIGAVLAVIVFFLIVIVGGIFLGDKLGLGIWIGMGISLVFAFLVAMGIMHVFEDDPEDSYGEKLKTAMIGLGLFLPVYGWVIAWAVSGSLWGILIFEVVAVPLAFLASRKI